MLAVCVSSAGAAGDVHRAYRDAVPRGAVTGREGRMGRTVRASAPCRTAPWTTSPTPSRGFSLPYGILYWGVKLPRVPAAFGGPYLDEQPSNALPVLGPEPPEEQALDEFAQPILGLLGGEKDGAGGSLPRCQ